VGPDSIDGREGKRPVFGVGMVKGKEDEFGEEKDIQTRVRWRRSFFSVSRMSS
jgi:hypothetical protein